MTCDGEEKKILQKEEMWDPTTAGISAEAAVSWWSIDARPLLFFTHVMLALTALLTAQSWNSFRSPSHLRKPTASDGEQDVTINPTENVNREKSFDLTVFKMLPASAMQGVVTKFLHKVHTRTQKARKKGKVKSGRKDAVFLLQFSSGKKSCKVVFFDWLSPIDFQKGSTLFCCL